MKRKITLPILFAALTLIFTGCAEKTPVGDQTVYEKYPSAHVLKLEGDSARLDGKKVREYDCTWRADPSLAEPQREGDEPDGTEKVYIAHDVIYFPQIDESAFSKENYDGETEWTVRYTAEGLENYLFGTLPVLGTEFPAGMMHSESEAYKNPVLHITEPGEYVIEGSFNGQLFFDFGDEDDTFTDKNASVTVIFNGADVTCTVAPAIVFHDVYECDNGWEDREKQTNVTDLSEAGVKIITVDGTENSVTGSNVYRLLKPEYKKNSDSVQKKLWKTDGAFYSFSSIEFNGEEKGTGILNITSTTFEGLDSELHLTVDGGYINIFSADDGINVNEDDVSVFTMNGGHLTIFAGLGAEGDVIDSNGFIRVNGGVLAGTSKSPSDELLDSECGVEVSEKATLIAGGSVSAGERQRDPGEPPMRPEGDPGDPPMRPEGEPGEPPERQEGEEPPTPRL